VTLKADSEYWTRRVLVEAEVDEPR
jgi:hypothetical protein